MVVVKLFLYSALSYKRCFQLTGAMAEEPWASRAEEFRFKLALECWEQNVPEMDVEGAKFPGCIFSCQMNSDEAFWSLND